jgi:hypothetical protein
MSQAVRHDCSVAPAFDLVTSDTAGNAPVGMLSSVITLRCCRLVVEPWMRPALCATACTAGSVPHLGNVYSRCRRAQPACMLRLLVAGCSAPGDLTGAEVLCIAGVPVCWDAYLSRCGAAVGQPSLRAIVNRFSGVPGSIGLHAGLPAPEAFPITRMSCTLRDGTEVTIDNPETVRLTCCFTSSIGCSGACLLPLCSACPFQCKLSCTKSALLPACSWLRCSSTASRRWGTHPWPSGPRSTPSGSTTPQQPPPQPSPSGRTPLWRCTVTSKTVIPITRNANGFDGCACC